MFSTCATFSYNVVHNALFCHMQDASVDKNCLYQAQREAFLMPLKLPDRPIDLVELQAFSSYRLILPMEQ